MDIWAYNYTFSDFVGNIGVVLLVGSYGALQFGKIKADDFAYSFSNLMVAVLLGYNLYYKPNISSIIIEIFWFFISVYGLWKWYQKRKHEN